jgi:hypothetical protein
VRIAGAVAGILVLLALAAGVVWQAGQRSEAAEHTLQVGLVANTLDARDQPGEQDQARRAGAAYIREEFRWAEVEPRQGARRWERLDRLMVNATRRGLRVLPLLLAAPRWATDGDRSFPRDPATFGAFAGAVAARYGPGGDFWRRHRGLDGSLAPTWFEVWNEPFFERFSRGGVDPAAYAALVQAATRAGKAANPRTRWLMAADVTYDDGPGPEVPWLDALYAAAPGLNASFDGVAVHPYTFLPPEATRGQSIRYRFDRIGTIVKQLDARGASDKPIWITELGWSTCARRPDCTDERSQARRIEAAFRLVRGQYRDRVRALFLYHLRDFGGWTEDRERWYGLLRPDGSRKPAWRAFRENATP